MICNTIGLTTDSFETLYVHGGAEVPEAYGSINYAQPIFYSLKTLTGATSYSFMGYPEPLKSYEIGGNMVQNGTPAPTSPIYPQDCGDRTGNLFDKSTITTSHFAYLSGVSPNNNYYCSDFIPITAATYYFQNVVGSNSQNSVVVYDANKLGLRYIKIIGGNKVSGAMTFQSGDAYIRVNCVSSTDVDTVMVNEGSTPLPYEPYGYKIPLNLNGTTQNIYLTEPLRKIGDYADSINSGGTVTRRIKKLVLTGDEPWALWQSGYTDVERYYYKWGKTVSSRSLICTHFQSIDYDGNFQHVRLGGSHNDDFAIFISRTIAPTVAGLKEYLAAQYAAGTPVTVWHIPATPTTEQVTVPTLTPATGNNTLAIDTTLQPSSLSITGHVKPSS